MQLEENGKSGQRKYSPAGKRVSAKSLRRKSRKPPEILEDTKTSTAADPMGDTETSEQTEQTDAVEMTVTEEEQAEKSVDTEGSGTTSMEET